MGNHHGKTAKSEDLRGAEVIRLDETTTAIALENPSMRGQRDFDCGDENRITQTRYEILAGRKEWLYSDTVSTIRALL
jgi:hypothetical protein